MCVCVVEVVIKYKNEELTQRLQRRGIREATRNRSCCCVCGGDVVKVERGDDGDSNDKLGVMEDDHKKWLF